MTLPARNSNADAAPSLTGAAHREAPHPNGNGAASANGQLVQSNPAGDWLRRNPVQSIWNRRWIVLVTLAACLAAAVAHLWHATPIYQATARLTVERNGPRIVANDPSDLTGQAQNFLNTQCEVLRSRKILSAVADDKLVQQMQTFAGNADQIVGYLKYNTSAGVGRKDDIIAVSVRSRFPGEAAFLANAIVETYKADLETRKMFSVRQVVDLFEREKLKTEKALAEARAAKLAFQRKNAELALGGGERASPTLDRLSRLSAALTDVQLESLNTRAAYEATRAMASDPQKIRQFLESRPFKGENAELRREMRELQQRFASVGRTYLPKHPDFGMVLGSIKQLQTQMDEEDKKTFDAYVAELDARLATLANNERQLTAFINDARAAAVAQSNSAAELASYEARCQSLEKYDQDLAMRIRELSPLSDEAMVNVNKIEDARAADAAGNVVEPNRANVLYLAMFGGLILGASLAFARDTLDQRLRGAEEIKHVLGLPILGSIPHIAHAKSRNAGAARQRGLQVSIDPGGDVAESYRTVRTSIYFGSPAGLARTLLITSPAPAEGKSTLASNLAIAMAQAGNRILLLDADFRKPTQHRIFAIEPNVGLSNVLAGEAALDDAVHHTDIAGLDVLPCGAVPANPSEILNSQAFADVLAELASRYDHVLLDSPPLMPVTDSRILAANCDATLLAVRAERTARKAAVHARDLLRSVGARLLGVVVNDIPRRRSAYGYYYPDASLYAYGYGRRNGDRNGNGRVAGGNSARSAVGANQPAGKT